METLNPKIDLKSEGSNQSPFLTIGCLLVFVLLLALYFQSRYHGMWGETDTATFTRAIREMYLSVDWCLTSMLIRMDTAFRRWQFF